LRFKSWGVPVDNRFEWRMVDRPNLPYLNNGCSGNGVHCQLTCAASIKVHAGPAFPLGMKGQYVVCMQADRGISK